ncbi:MAG TPA: type I glyceraldehyde-3-phosphate dehydrogenase [Desulfobulbus sp.]|nr:type I glyceraldehyde-3-phosphate dehydrogenase [Desulfobulbus sp.]
MTRLAINGLGRIGRLVLRHYMEETPQGVEIVAANDLVPTRDLAYLLKYDSVHGRARFPVTATNDGLRLGDRAIRITAITEPDRLPWRELDVDVVLECTGRFVHRRDAARHLDAGAGRVVISAPSPDADYTVVMGVNDDGYDPDRHRVISNASCTTNSLAPAMKVLLDNFGVDMALVTTIHAYTATQGLVDRPAKKPIRGRAAAVNLIPTSTGSDKATAMVLPALKGRLRAIAVRAPVADGALTDINALLARNVTEDEVNEAFRRAAGQPPLQGILGYSEEELVSSDIIGDPRSGIVHALSTRVVQGRMAKVQVWYDNEYGYSRRLFELASRLDG